MTTCPDTVPTTMMFPMSVSLRACMQVMSADAGKRSRRSPADSNVARTTACDKRAIFIGVRTQPWHESTRWRSTYHSQHCTRPATSPKRQAPGPGEGHASACGLRTGPAQTHSLGLRWKQGGSPSEARRLHQTQTPMCGGDGWLLQRRRKQPQSAAHGTVRTLRPHHSRSSHDPTQTGP